jgi:hypothetical protein
MRAHAPQIDIFSLKVSHKPAGRRDDDIRTVAQLRLLRTYTIATKTKNIDDIFTVVHQLRDLIFDLDRSRNRHRLLFFLAPSSPAWQSKRPRYTWSQSSRVGTNIIERTQLFSFAPFAFPIKIFWSIGMP